MQNIVEGFKPYQSSRAQEIVIFFSGAPHGDGISRFESGEVRASYHSSSVMLLYPLMPG